MKNTLYFLVIISLYFLATNDCQAQYNPVNYDLYIQNDVYAGNSDTAATTGNLIAINTVFSGGAGSYFATGSTLQDGFTVEDGGSLFLSIPIVGDVREGKLNFIAEKSTMRVYPNPTTDVVNISLTDHVGSSTVRVEVYSLNTSDMLYSEKIQQKNVSTMKVNLSSLPKGIYILKVYKEEGTKAITRKLIKN